MTRKQSSGERLFLFQWRAAGMESDGIPQPVREYRGIPGRKFAFDFAWPEKMVCLEVDGGIITGGRHVRIKGYMNDCEKQNLAIAAGWRYFRITPYQLKDDPVRWINFLAEQLK